MKHAANLCWSFGDSSENCTGAVYVQKLYRNCTETAHSLSYKSSPPPVPAAVPATMLLFLLALACPGPTTRQRARAMALVLALACPCPTIGQTAQGPAAQQIGDGVYSFTSSGRSPEDMIILESQLAEMQY